MWFAQFLKYQLQRWPPSLNIMQLDFTWFVALKAPRNRLKSDVSSQKSLPRYSRKSTDLVWVTSVGTIIFLPNYTRQLYQRTEGSVQRSRVTACDDFWQKTLLLIFSNGFLALWATPGVTTGSIIFEGKQTSLLMISQKLSPTQSIWMDIYIYIYIYIYMFKSVEG